MRCAGWAEDASRKGRRARPVVLPPLGWRGGQRAERSPPGLRTAWCGGGAGAEEPPSQVFGVYPEELWESLQDVRPRTGMMRFAFLKTTPGQSGR